MTRRQWFETLPAPYAERAIRNAERYGAPLEAPQDNLSGAIAGSFDWSDTPEGNIFWRDVHRGELPPIPDVTEPATAASGLQVRVGYRYRTRDGMTTGYVEPSGCIGQPFLYRVPVDTYHLVRFVSPNGNWMGDGSPSDYDLVEEIPPTKKMKYRITEVRHFFLEAEDEIEADRMFRVASNPERKFRMHTEDRTIHDDA